MNTGNIYRTQKRHHIFIKTSLKMTDHALNFAAVLYKYFKTKVFIYKQSNKEAVLIISPHFD